MTLSAPTSEATTPPERLHLRIHSAVLMLLVALPSTALFQKYTGLAGVLAYLLIVAVVWWVVLKTSLCWAPWARRGFQYFAGLACSGLILIFVVVHPIEDGKGPGKSSDRDEGLNLAATRLMAGKTPYYPANPEAGPLSVLPGSILLATPFVALGNSAYQNIFWLAVFLGTACWFFKDGALALILLGLPLALSPVAQYEFISGGDLISNGIFVAVFALAAITVWANPASPAWQRWLTCLLLGMAFASRANFLLLAPLFGAAVWRISGPRPAILASLLVGLTSLALTVPFYLNNPGEFTPLLTKAKLGGVDHALPWASKAMIAATILASLISACWLIFKREGRPIIGFFRCCTYVTLTPIICSILLASFWRGQLDLRILQERFGLMFVFFALFGWGAALLSTESDDPMIR
jgi:hypothetical protein